MAHEDDAAEWAPVAPELFVPDVAEAATFYEQALGFRIVRLEPDFAILALGRCVLMLADERMYGEMGGDASGRRGELIDVRFVVPAGNVVYRRGQGVRGPLPRLNRRRARCPAVLPLLRAHSLLFWFP